MLCASEPQLFRGVGEGGRKQVTGGEIKKLEGRNFLNSCLVLLQTKIKTKNQPKSAFKEKQGSWDSEGIFLFPGPHLTQTLFPVELHLLSTASSENISLITQKHMSQTQEAVPGLSSWREI